MVLRYELSNENLFMPLFSSLISLHNCSQLDLQLAGEEGDIASFIPNGEWSLLGEIHSSSVLPPRIGWHQVPRPGEQRLSCRSLQPSRGRGRSEADGHAEYQQPLRLPWPD